MNVDVFLSPKARKLAQGHAEETQGANLRHSHRSKVRKFFFKKMMSSNDLKTWNIF